MPPNFLSAVLVPQISVMFFSMHKQEEKRKIRKKMKEILKEIMKPQERSELVFKKILDKSLLNKVQFVSVYISMPNEVDTKYIIKYCWSKSIVVCVPEFGRIDNEEKFFMREYVRNGEVKEEAFGVKLPKYGPIHKVEEIDLMFVPGLAFTEDGERLGRGKAYYDRLLDIYDGKTVGLCFKEQILDELPHEEHDKKVDELISC